MSLYDYSKLRSDDHEKGNLDDSSISDECVTSEDIQLIFEELNITPDDIENFPSFSGEDETKRDEQVALEDAIQNLHDANVDKAKSCASCSKEIRVERVSSLRRGQHISVPGEKYRKFNKYTHKLVHTYKHHAIIKEIKEASGTKIKMEVIHFTEKNDKYQVCKLIDTYDLEYHELYIVEYTYPRYTAEQIVCRAESILPKTDDEQHGFGEYNLGTNNCEHFATWCVVGEEESFQSQSWCKTFTNFIQRLFGAGSKLAKLILRICSISSDEIAARLSAVLNIPEFMFGGTAALYFLRCIFMTVSYKNKLSSRKLCKACCKRKLQNIWYTFAVFGATSVAAFVILNFALPLMTTPVGIPIIILLILLSIALQWSVPKIRKAVMSPFVVDKKKIKQFSGIEIGDVVLLKYYLIEHAVIVTEVHEEKTNSRKGRIRGVHYGLPAIFSRREVLEEYFEIDLTNSTVKVFDCSHLLTNTPEETIMRARKRVGEKKWVMTSNRSDHLCFWAKVRQRHHKICGNRDNGDLDAPSSNNLSSLHLEPKEVHLESDLQLGDVIKYKELGILVRTVNLDNERGRQFVIEMIEYDRQWYGRKKAYAVDLNEDSIVKEHYHPAHCHPMAVRVERANRLKDKKGAWWTDKGFIEHCIMLNP